MKKTPEQVHYNMSRIRAKDTGIEVKLRKELLSRGIRYRKNVKDITGKPDLAFIGKKIAVFCDSEFWHGYDWENKKKDIKSNQEFWLAKISRNIERDQEVNERLKKEGWTVLRFWGKDIQRNAAECANIIEAEVRKHEQV